MKLMFWGKAIFSEMNLTVLGKNKPFYNYFVVSGENHIFCNEFSKKRQQRDVTHTHALHAHR